jgi:ubiquinone/menaquinone biosynthesis C-methylase UbiE
MGVERRATALMRDSTGMTIDPEITAHYELGIERDRLTTWGRLEAARTRELLDRYLPPPPTVILDVGGAEGAYALPLAAAGYTVHLLDAMDSHVEIARAASATQPAARRLASATVGDARALPFEDASADAVLMLGPLYHLIDAGDRATALTEARRVLRRGGVLLAAVISRFASTLDGLRLGFIHDPAFERIVEGDLRDGVHRNPDVTGHPQWFTTAYFHTPQSLHDEVERAGLSDVQVIAIEGIGAAAELNDAIEDPGRRETIMRAIRRLESEPSLLGISPHLMAIAARP